MVITLTQSAYKNGNIYSYDELIRLDLARTEIKEKYGQNALECFTEYMDSVNAKNASLAFDEFLYIGELLVRDSN